MSPVTGQASVTLEWRNTPRRTTNEPNEADIPMFIVDDAIYGSARKIPKMILGVSL